MVKEHDTNLIFNNYYLLFCHLQHNKTQRPDPVPESPLGVREQEAVNYRYLLEAAQVTKSPAMGWGRSISKTWRFDAALPILCPGPQACAGVLEGREESCSIVTGPRELLWQDGCSAIALTSAHSHVTRSCLFGGGFIRNRFLSIQTLLSLVYKKCCTKHFYKHF